MSLNARCSIQIYVAEAGRPWLLQILIGERLSEKGLLELRSEAAVQARKALVGLDSDPRFSTNAARVANRMTLLPLLTAAIATFPRDALVRDLVAAGVTAAPILSVPEALASPQATALNMVETMHVNAGAAGGAIGPAMRVVRHPVTLEGTPAQLRSGPPELGSHTSEVMREWLGAEAATRLLGGLA